MIGIEIRRHSVRNKPEEHLSSLGRELAREVGRNAGPFPIVISSPSPRAVETAMEMGYARPELRASWASLGPEVDREIPWPAPFEGYRRAVRAGGAATRRAESLVEELAVIRGSIPAASSVLVITHGGFPELVAVALLPATDPRGWGGPIRCMEGIRISFEEGRARACEILRLPDERSRL